MSRTRGDVCLARIPHADGGRGKKRPVVVIQSDVYQQFRHFVVAEITSNLTLASDPACLLIELRTPEGHATGLKQDSVVTCLFLITMSDDRIGTKIGELSPSLLTRLDSSLKAALGIR